MKRGCIAVVDAAHARLYAYDAGAETALRELRDLVNPGRRLRPSEMFSETRPALAKAAGGLEPSSAKDDHRDDHIEMMDAKFAKEVVVQIEQLLHAESLPALILIASPKMLGELRKAKQWSGVSVQEIARDLTKLTSAQLHDHLAGLKLISPRERITVAR